MVVSNDSEAVEHMRYLSQQAKDDPLYFVHQEYGYNYRMTNLQAALGLAQLEQLDSFLDIKRKNYNWYCEALAECNYGYIQPFRSGDSSNHWYQEAVNKYNAFCLVTVNQCLLNDKPELARKVAKFIRQDMTRDNEKIYHLENTSIDAAKKAIADYDAEH